MDGGRGVSDWPSSICSGAFSLSLTASSLPTDLLFFRDTVGVSSASNVLFPFRTELRGVLSGVLSSTGPRRVLVTISRFGSLILGVPSRDPLSISWTDGDRLKIPLAVLKTLANMMCRCNFLAVRGAKILGGLTKVLPLFTAFGA